MKTISLNIKPHIAEWLNSQFSHNGVIVLKPKSFLFSALVSELKTYSDNNKIYTSTKTNCVFALPFWIKKHRSINMYITPKGVLNFQRKAEWMFWADAERFIINARRQNISIVDAAFGFIEQNNISSISVDAIVKFFYRIRIQKKKC